MVSKLRKQRINSAFPSKPTSSAAIQKAENLSPEQRSALEGLLGRQIFDNEVISIRAITPPATSEASKQELLQQLSEYFAQLDAGHQPIPDEEAEDIINEAMKSVRPGYRAHQ
jgi:hypothetical protein